MIENVHRNRDKSSGGYTACTNKLNWWKDTHKTTSTYYWSEWNYTKAQLHLAHCHLHCSVETNHNGISIAVTWFDSFTKQWCCTPPNTFLLLMQLYHFHLNHWKRENYLVIFMLLYSLNCNFSIELLPSYKPWSTLGLKKLKRLAPSSPCHK